MSVHFYVTIAVYLLELRYSGSVPAADLHVTSGLTVQGSTVQLMCLISDYAFTNKAELYKMSSENDRPGASVVACIGSTCLPGSANIATRYSYSRNDSGLYLTISDLNRSEDQAWWRCILVNTDPPNTEDVVYLIVYESQNPIVTFTASPAMVNQGATVNLTCTIDQAIDIQTSKFYRNGSYRLWLYQLSESDPCSHILAGSDDGNTYKVSCNRAQRWYQVEIENVGEVEHGVEWYCEMTSPNSAGACIANSGSTNPCISERKTVFVIVPVTSVSLVSPIPNENTISVVSGQHLTLQCRTSSGRPAPTVRWYLGGVEQTVGISNTTGTDREGLTFTISYLSLSANRDDNGKTVQCTAVNYEGMLPVELPSRPTLNIEYGPGDSVGVSNNHYAVTEGGRVGPITCTADCNPPCSFQWLKDDVLINVGPVLEMNAVSRVHGGEYNCEASTLLLGESKSSQVSLRIEVYYSPEITTNVGGDTYEVNDNVTLTCTVDAVPDPNITWYIQGDNSPLQSSITTSSTIRLINIQCNQMSNYICKAENTIGSTEMPNEVLVKCPPKESLPYGRNVLGSLGSEVVLRITTVSFRLPSFTWRDPDENIIMPPDGRYSQTVNGDNCMLVIHDLQTMGSYKVTVSNGVKPDAVFEFTVRERAIANSVDECSRNSIGLSLGLAFAGLVVGSILFSIICLYRKQLHRSQCCRERLYAKPKRQTDEHTYSEVTSPPSMEMTGSRDERSMRMTDSETPIEVQIGQTYVNTGNQQTQTYVNE